MIAIVGALDAELALFRSNISDGKVQNDGPFTFHTGNLSRSSVVIVKSGVGKVLAAMTAQKLISSFQPSHIIFTGIAGALRKDLDLGDLVIGRDYIQHDMDCTGLGVARGEIPYTGIRIVPGSESLVKAASSFSIKKRKCIVGRILSGDQFIEHSHSSSHAYLTEELGGDAVEMEGASMAFVCHLHKIPFVALRTISDRADHGAVVDFENFLPVASHQSLEVVRHILTQLGSL